MSGKDDPAIKKRRQQRQKKTAAENTAALSIADRLTRRAHAQIVELPYEDEDGKFSIEIRTPTRKELDNLLKLQKDLQNTKDPGLQEKSGEELYQLLGELCQDPSLGYPFWKEGNYSMEDFIEIFTKLFQGYVDQIQEVQSFRED